MPTLSDSRSEREKHYAPVKAYSKPGELIALRHAMKNYLGRDSGLAAVIRAVVDGSLVPVGYTNRFRGITGYLFRSEDLRKYRPVPGVTVPPEGFLFSVTVHVPPSILLDKSPRIV